MEFIPLYMLIGFLISVYSVIANDSVQTLGTFLSSNRNVKWWILALAASILMILTLAQGWYENEGDLAYGRLDKIPYDPEVSPLVIIGPLALLVLTWYGFPVSTTFLILSIFAFKSTIEDMILKSLMGYVIAFISAYLIWKILNAYLNTYFSNQIESKTKRNFWTIAQWIATGYLWSIWITHDFANIVVFLPRKISLDLLLMIMGITTVFIFYIFSQKGGKIQDIVEKKTNTVLIQNATLIDFIFATILYYFKQVNSIPMSTTWVFVGLLAGRELAIHHYNNKKLNTESHKIYPMIIKDFSKVVIGLVISLGIALLIGYV